ncbi:MAG: flagellar basal body-associated FliL family protein [Spirochaetales bacterium]|nr:flagellar basal body-associated FliL family protein [Spirochaetales bacterium]
MSKTERALAVVIAVVLVVIVAGTTWAVLTGSRARKLAREAVPVELASGGVYDGIGRVRASTADTPPAIVVLDVAFPYDASDRQFREELRRKHGELRAAATAFLSSKTADELSPANEATVKAALRDTLNALLSLGRIEELYFPEFHVVD